MTDAQLVQLTHEALVLAALLLSPVLLAAAVVGVVSGLLQSATQVQDAALSFVPKLAAVGAALYLSLGPMRERLTDFAARVLQACG